MGIEFIIPKVLLKSLWLKEEAAMNNPSQPNLSASTPNIKVFDAISNDVQLIRPNKIKDILDRDVYQCRGCESREMLSVVQLLDPSEYLSCEVFPIIFHATLCEECRKRLLRINEVYISKFSDDDFEFWIRIYHPGLFRAEQHLQYEI